MPTFVSLVLLCSVAVTAATNILLTNDDGWAVAQIRAQFSAIDAEGYDVSAAEFRLHRSPQFWRTNDQHL